MADRPWRRCCAVGAAGGGTRGSRMDGDSTAAGVAVEVAVAGWDSEGRTFLSAEQMWREEAGEDDGHTSAEAATKRREWYGKGVGYWQVGSYWRDRFCLTPFSFHLIEEYKHIK